jgi:hypothetical protein
MKHRILILLLCLVCGIAHVQGQDDVFKKISDMDHVTSVYISPKMFQLMSRMEDEDKSMKELISRIRNLQILSSSTSSVINVMRREMNALHKNKGYEELVRVKEGKESSVISSKKQGNTYDYILTSDSPDEYTIIFLQGNFSLEEVQLIMDRMP